MFKEQFTQINILRGEPSEHMSFLIFDHHLSKKVSWKPAQIQALELRAERMQAKLSVGFVRYKLN